jgi:uncharacterized protein (TIGR02266 family)
LEFECEVDLGFVRIATVLERRALGSRGRKEAMTESIKREDGRISCSEQRNHARVQLPRVSARYAANEAETVVAVVHDIGVGGMFLRAARPLPPGSRIDFEIRVEGEGGPMGAVGRVMWTREEARTDGAPTGMGVRFVQLDREACDVIGRLVVIRQQTMHGIGPEDTALALPSALAGPAVPPMRAPEESAPLHLVHRKETPLELVKRKTKNVPAHLELELELDDVATPASLPGLALDMPSPAPAPPLRRRLSSSVPIASIVVLASALLVALLPTDEANVRPSAFGATRDDVPAFTIAPPAPHRHARIQPPTGALPAPAEVPPTMIAAVMRPAPASIAALANASTPVTPSDAAQAAKQPTPAPSTTARPHGAKSRGAPKPKPAP